MFVLVKMLYNKNKHMRHERDLETIPDFWKCVAFGRKLTKWKITIENV